MRNSCRTGSFLKLRGDFGGQGVQTYVLICFPYSCSHYLCIDFYFSDHYVFFLQFDKMEFNELDVYRFG